MVILTSFRELFTCGVWGCVVVLLTISGLVIGVDLGLSHLGVPSDPGYKIGDAVVVLLLLFGIGRTVHWWRSR